MHALANRVGVFQIAMHFVDASASNMALSVYLCVASMTSDAVTDAIKKLSTSTQSATHRNLSPSDQ